MPSQVKPVKVAGDWAQEKTARIQDMATSASELPQCVEVEAQPGSSNGAQNGNRIKPNNRKLKRHKKKCAEKLIPFNQRDNFPADTFGFFEKKRDLRSTADKFELPSSSLLFKESKWSLDEMLALKRRLNATKELLNDLDLKNWHHHTSEMNPAGLISKTIRKNYMPEYCSQAWLKFTECLFSYDVVPKMIKCFHSGGYLSQINTLHLCEAPGAFISATNHYLRTKFKNVKWTWTGLTLNPHHEGNSLACMINEDKLILSSMNNWDFFKDNTGNLISSRNIIGFLKRARSPNIYHFVTADGSVDCQLNPGEQEATVGQLHTAEIVTALFSLLPGGSFVLKIFTFLECKEICHLYLLACAFKNVHLFKPGTSKEGNSEVYVVCTDFIGTDLIKDQLLNILEHIDLEIQDKDKAIFPLSCVDPKFIDRVLEAATFFTELQISVILKNIKTFKIPRISQVYEAVRERKLQISKEYLRLYPVESLPLNGSIFGSGRLATDASLHTDPRSETGTFTDRCNRTALSFNEFLAITQTELQRLFQENVQEMFAAVEIPPEDGVTEWQITTGKSYDNILSSRFCIGKLLTIRQVFREYLTRHFMENCSVAIPRETSHHCNMISLLLKLLNEATGFKIRPGDFEVVCFKETAYSFGYQSDADGTRMRLSQLIDKILVLGPGCSIFLCEFPLLTRLHVAFIHACRPYFTRVSVMYASNGALTGIILHRFLDINAAAEGLFDKLCVLKKNLDSSDTENLILQICQMPKIYASRIVKTYLNYNISNICLTLNQRIQKFRSLAIAIAPPLNRSVSDSKSSSAFSS